MKIKVNDNVLVIAGKNKGKSGKVLHTFDSVDKITVEGINIAKKAVKASDTSKGGFVEIEKPLHVSNVMLVCPHTGKPTRIGYTGTGKDKRRVSKKSGKAIDDSRSSAKKK